MGEAADGAAAVELAERVRPDVVLMDADIAEPGDCESCGLIRDFAPDTKFLFSLTYVAQLDAGITARADGYWLKDDGRDALIQAIHSLAPPEPNA